MESLYFPLCTLVGSWVIFMNACQRRRRSKPLPAKLLGALPSTINKAADLAYEVEQEVSSPLVGPAYRNTYE